MASASPESFTTEQHGPLAARLADLEEPQAASEQVRPFVLGIHHRRHVSRPERVERESEHRTGGLGRVPVAGPLRADDPADLGTSSLGRHVAEMEGDVSDESSVELHGERQEVACLLQADVARSMAEVST